MRGDNWLIFAFLIFILSLILKQVALALVCLLFLLTGGVSRLWNHFCLHRVEFRRHLSQNKVFFGEEITYEIEVTNRKILPLAWLQVEDELPEKVQLLKGKAEATTEERVILQQTFPINMYHRVRRRYPMRCTQRGAFIFGPARLRSGDLFGFFRREAVFGKLDYLLVYPRLVPLEKLGIPSRQLFGDIRLRRHLFQDPVLTYGVRDYVPGDSLKRIHWKTTARLQKLQTKLYEPTTTVDISLFLDVRTLKAPLWGSIHQLQELGIITAAAIAQAALAAGFRVGLTVNQRTRFSKGILRVPESGHPEQLLHVLEALAQVHQVETVSMARLIRREAPSLPWGSTILVISAQPTEELLSVLVDLKRVGRGVALVMVGGEKKELASSAGGGVSVYQVTDEVAWQLVEEIGLVEMTDAGRR
ncbi:MAG: DUF58 domain-containing protein [Dehalococcoidales bacterium]|nr:DUF58 domain-containing protein [Dehalococcoidales bacterium]